jgi:protein ImuB
VLQLLAEPRRLRVESVSRRDHAVPVRFRDRGGWREVAMAAGPDRISGGRWEAEPFAREYYRCVTDEGMLLWVYRDGRDGGWYLHGWWD